MKLLLPFLIASLLSLFLAFTINGQISTPCTPSMLTNFPCMNFLTNSSGNGGTSPTADCCSSLKNLTGNGLNCLCLIVTASVPFQLPINRSLAISLPRACNMPGVPVQCKASSGSPLPAPGPASLGPTLAPGESPAASPTASFIPDPTPSGEAPESNTTPGLTSPSPNVDSGSETPIANPGSRPDLIPSSAMASCTFSPSLLLPLALGFVRLI